MGVGQRSEEGEEEEQWLPQRERGVEGPRGVDAEFLAHYVMTLFIAVFE